MTSGCEDWALYLRIAYDYPFGVVPEVLVGYRQLTTSMSRGLRFMLRGHQMMLEYLKSRQISVNEVAVKQQQYCMSIYALCRAVPVCSRNFWRTFADVLSADPLFCFRWLVIKNGLLLLRYKVQKVFRRRSVNG